MEYWVYCPAEQSMYDYDEIEANSHQEAAEKWGKLYEVEGAPFLINIASRKDVAELDYFNAREEWIIEKSKDGYRAYKNC